MKIISHKQAHAEFVREHGKLKVNGVTFNPGEHGKAVAYGVSEADVARFCGVEGYSFYHEDTGQLAGESHTYYSPARQVETLQAGGDLESQIMALIRSGQLDPEAVARIAGQSVTTVRPSEAPTPVILGPGGEAVASVGQAVRYTLTEQQVQAENTQILPAQHTEPVPTQHALQSEQKNSEDDVLNLADSAALARLPRNDLLGLAKSLGVAYAVTESNLVIADKIAAHHSEAAAPLNQQEQDEEPLTSL